MKNCAVIHYAEIGLKGRNRNAFELKLKDNIEAQLKKSNLNAQIKIITGRFLLFFDNESEKEKIIETLKKVFGIQYFSTGYVVEKEITSIEECVCSEAERIRLNTFCIRAKRTDKNFFLSSQQINEKLGAVVLDKFPSAKVNLDEPDTTFYIEVLYRNAIVYVNKIQGLGGLPTGIEGKALCLLSGGIDSPVAAFLSMKRGCKAIFLHFHSYPLTNIASIEKVKEIVQILSSYQDNTSLILLPFAEIQKEIVSNTPSEYRVILYRRFMLRIAEIIMNREGADAIVTGESLGQVASQTLSNMQTIQNVTTSLILRPLIGLDKNEIVELAKKIGTYETSIQPHQDCCSYLMPKNPLTHSTELDLKKVESNLNVDKLVEVTLSNVEKINY